MRFVKMEGLGNDFVVVDGPGTVGPEAVRALCDRRRGIGADGVLMVTPGDEAVRMDYWNADGSAAELCGNGLRCVARYAYDRGWGRGEEFAVDTAVGRRRVAIGPGETVTVELGPVELTSDGVAEIGGVEVETAAVGNPHAVVFVPDPKTAPVAEVGARLERDGAFPEGTNVEFVAVAADGGLDLRVWERGVGETLACGTGAAAAVAVAHRRGEVPATATVRLPGGTLVVTLDEAGAWITGPARYVFVGEWDDDQRTLRRTATTLPISSTPPANSIGG